MPFLVLDFPVVRTLGKFHINLQYCLKKLLASLLDLSFYWVTITSIFLFLQHKFLVSDVINCVLNRLEVLESNLLPSAKDRRSSN